MLLVQSSSTDLIALIYIKITRFLSQYKVDIKFLFLCFRWLSIFFKKDEIKVCRFKWDLYFCRGELAEWSIAAVLKTVDLSKGPRVRIPHSPPNGIKTNEKPANRKIAGFFDSPYLFLGRGEGCLPLSYIRLLLDFVRLSSDSVRP